MPVTNQTNPSSQADLAARRRGHGIGIAMTALSAAAIGWLFFVAR